MKKYVGITLLFLSALCQAQLQPLKISANKRYFTTGEGKPFFWLGDTGWLLFVKCTREQAVQYLDDRQAKGFNVVQVMVIHDINLGVNVYGDSAIQNKDVSKPATTPGDDYKNAAAYDFWDHMDFVIDEAAKRGIYMALVPIWGGNIKHVSVEQAKGYAAFLANRYKNRSNIIWLNGGDIKGSDGLDQWNAIGETINTLDNNHLITYHPRGRNSSSEWFHKKDWLDFNMFQSGHRSYAQDTSANETLHYGEDNWRYVKVDYDLKPTKPTLDGEPSYEDIPYGLHKADEPYWQDHEVRRYAYWSVFAGAAGFTYGHNSIMQFYTNNDPGTSFFPRISWQQALDAPGARQMHHLKDLMTSMPFQQAKPCQELATDNGEKYDRIIATAAKTYAMFYTYNGRSFNVLMKKLNFKPGKATWFSPANGERQILPGFQYKKSVEFDPPGAVKNGNDWVLILEK